MNLTSQDCDECYQHDDNVGIRVVPQLPQPALNVLVGQVLGNVVDKQGTNCTPVVPGQKRSINSRYNHLFKHVLSKDLHDHLSCEISIGIMQGHNLRWSDGSVALLSSGVPDLRFDRLSIHLSDYHVHDGDILGKQAYLSNI